jgi:hypothetical protein
MGYCAYTHNFHHAGIVLRNVIADLPGTGSIKIDPKILDKLRDIFLRYPTGEPDEDGMREVVRILGDEWTNEFRIDALSSREISSILHKICNSRPWFPWWLRRICGLAGIGSKIVIVGCHLDSAARCHNQVVCFLSEFPDIPSAGRITDVPCTRSASWRCRRDSY